MSATLEHVLDEVRAVGDLFVDAGHSIYLVGGIVRDLALGTEIVDLDFDLTTDARPRDIRRIVQPVASAVWTQGERFGTIGCTIDGRAFEITTHRAEWYSSDSRKPDVRFGDDIGADLSRRDFTVNAMARRLPDGELIDPYGGLADLERRRLATPIDPLVSFADDPLRILRAARFVARHALVPDDDLVDAATELADRLSIVSAERIREELDKLLSAVRPGAGIRFLAHVGALEFVLEHVPPSDVVGSADVLDRAEPVTMLRRLVLFALCDADDRRPQMSALRYSKDEIRTMLTVLDGLERLSAGSGWSDERLRRLIDQVGLDRMDVLFALGALRGVEGAEAGRRAFGELSAREDLSSFDPALTGDQIMEELGLTEGPEVGGALSRLRERRLRDGPAGRDVELEYLRSGSNRG